MRGLALSKFSRPPVLQPRPHHALGELVVGAGATEGEASFMADEPVREIVIRNPLGMRSVDPVKISRSGVYLVVGESARRGAFLRPKSFYWDFPISAAAIERQSASSRLLSELEEYRLLSDDWDGEGCPAPDPAHIFRAQELVNAMSFAGFQLPRPMVGVAGVSLYWKRPIRAGVHIEQDGSYTAYRQEVEPGKKGLTMQGLRLADFSQQFWSRRFPELVSQAR